MRTATQIALASAALVALAAGAANAGGSFITAFQKGGRLSLTGDDTSSAIAIRSSELASDHYVIEGLDGALINGSTSRLFGGVTRIEVDLGGGDDALLLTARAENGPVLDPVFPALSVQDAAGDDLVVFDHVSMVGKVGVELGTGADTIAVFVSTLAAAVRFSTGDGSDATFVGLSSWVRAKLQANLGSGDDVAVVDNTLLDGKTSLVLGSGEDAAGLAVLGGSAPVALNGGLGSDLARDDGAGAPERKLKAVEDAQTTDDDLVYDLIEDHPGFVAAQDLVNSHGVGLN
jgi:hypothetical protein